MANGYIGQVHIDSTDYKIGSTLFAVLDTANSQGTIATSNGTTTFTVPLDGFVNTSGVTVHIKFVQANSEPSNLALKVGSDSAHPISNPNGALTWQANSVISFTYDGINWVMNSTQVSGGSLSNVSFGNIQSNGTLQTNDVAIADGDKLIITDASDSNKVARSSTAFDGSTESKVLSKKGTWVDMYTHPTGAGNNHIPSGGSSGQFLKYSSSGAAAWASLTKSDITDFPNYAGSSSQGGAANSVANNLVLKFDSGSTEGTSLYTFNGSAGKTIDIKAGDNISLTSASGSITIASTYSYTLPLAANGTRGGIQIGYSESNSGSDTSRNYAVKLSSEKAYVNVPWTDTKVKQTAKTDSVAYKLLFSAAGASPTSGTAYEAVYYTGLTFNPSSKTLSIVDGSTTGTLTATNYSGKAATAGTADSANSVALANVSNADDLKAIEALEGTSGLLKKTAANEWTLDTTSYATTDTVNNLLATNDAMIFKGALDGGTSSTTYTPAAERGWTYKVTTAGLINGESVEVGDVLICAVDSTAAATSSNVGTVKANWIIVQTNIDGAVTGPTSSTSGHIATFNGSSGHLIQDSGYTIATSVPANAVFTDKKVEQKKYTSSTNSEFRLLFKKSANNTDETDLVYYSDIANKNITYNPSTGALSAAKFIGDGSSLTNITASSVALTDVTDADDLKAIEALSGTSGFLKKTTANTWTLDTSTYLTSQDTTHLYVNKTASPGTSPSNAAVTTSDTLYLHLYDSTTKRDSIQIKGSGGTSITATNGQVITITSKTYSATTTTVLNSLTLKYTDSLGDHTETPSADTFVAAVNGGTLFIKSIVYGTDSTVNTGFTPNN